MAGILRLDELQNTLGIAAAQLASNGAFIPSQGLQLPNFTNSNRPSNPTTGLLIYNSDIQGIEMWNGTQWALVFSSGIGLSQAVPATSASQIQQFNPSATNGLYWIKPSGYGGAAVEAYVDFDGTTSGISDPGPWVRVRYASDYYSRANAWKGQTGLTNPGAESTTAYSGDFDFEQPYQWIDSLLDNADEIRQMFESWGYGSVGWTYQGNNPYMEGKGFNGVPYTRWSNTGGSHTGVSPNNRLNGMSHSVTSINGPYDNPTAANTDPTDQNDSVWRVGVFYFKSTIPANKHLPIRGVWNADVDGSTEQRYFPFRTGEANGGVNSDIWIKN